MTNKERYATKRTFYQIVWGERGMVILGALAGPFKTLKEAQMAKKEYDGGNWHAAPVIRKVTYKIVK